VINNKKFIVEMRKRIQSFQAEILTKFGRVLNAQIKQLVEDSKEHRLRIEECRVEYKSNSISAFVYMRRDMKMFLADLETKVEHYSRE